MLAEFQTPESYVQENFPQLPEEARQLLIDILQIKADTQRNIAALATMSDSVGINPVRLDMGETAELLSRFRHGKRRQYIFSDHEGVRLFTIENLTDNDGLGETIDIHNGTFSITREHLNTAFMGRDAKLKVSTAETPADARIDKDKLTSTASLGKTPSNPIQAESYHTAVAKRVLREMTILKVDNPTGNLLDFLQTFKTRLLEAIVDIETDVLHIIKDVPGYTLRTAAA